MSAVIYSLFFHKLELLFCGAFKWFIHCAIIYIYIPFISTSLHNLSAKFWSQLEVSSSPSSGSYQQSSSSSSATSRQLHPCNIDPIVEAQIMDRTIDFEVYAQILLVVISFRPSLRSKDPKFEFHGTHPRTSRDHNNTFL